MHKLQIDGHEVILGSYVHPDVDGHVFPYATVVGPDGWEHVVALQPERISIAEANRLAAKEAVRRIRTNTL